MTEEQHPDICCYKKIHDAESDDGVHYRCVECGCDVSLIRKWYDNRMLDAVVCRDLREKSS